MNDKLAIPKLIHDEQEGTVEVYEDFVSVKEAARLMRVSEATTWRWINQMLLPAYRFGHKRVYIKREDLKPLIKPAREKGESMAQAERPRIRPLTVQERESLLDAVNESKRRLTQMLEDRGGRLYPSSSEILDNLRDERSRQLA